MHHYFGINFDIVWDIIQDALSELGGKIENFLNKKS